MLAVTPAAAAAVASLLENPDLPEGAGLRLQRGLDATGQSAIGLAIVDEPDPDDEMVAAVESEVFIAPDIVELVDNQVLDAEIDDRDVAFTLRPQSVNGQPPPG